MAIVLDGTTGITNDGGYTGDGVVFADTTPANTLVTTNSGNVGIGTSSPGGKLAVVTNANSQQWLALQNTNAGSSASNGILFGNDANAAYGTLYLNSSANSSFGQAGGMVLGTYASTALTFITGASERARIDSSGNQIIGGITPYGRVTIYASGANSAALAFQDTNTSGRRWLMGPGVGTGSAGMFSFYDATAGAVRVSVDSNGYLIVPGIYNLTTGAGANVHVAADGTLYRSTSSLKYKTDVQDATHGLAQVMQLRPVTYKGKNDGDLVFGGLIAEEVHEAGLTEFVQYAEDGTPDALAYANMVSLAFKAIQEQQAIITALTARVSALEGTQNV